MNQRSLHFVTSLALATVAAAADLQAATHTWSGNGANGLWSTAANWENNNPPVANESPTGLIFPSVANRRLSTNNVAGLQVTAWLMEGAAYTFRGTGPGTNITLLPGGLFGSVAVSGTGHSLEGSLNLVLNGTNQFTIATGASLGVPARLTGNGSLRKSGDGVLRLRPAGSNNLGGFVEVAGGVLELAAGGNAIPGPLIIGTTNAASPVAVTLLADDQIADNAPVQIHQNGELQLNTFNEAIGPLTLFAGTVETDGGTLSPESITGVKSGAGIVGSAGTVRGILQLHPASPNFVSVLGDTTGRLELEASVRGGSFFNPAVFEKDGPGAAYLYASNSFVGATRVQEGTLHLLDPTGLGSKIGGTFIATNAQLVLHDIEVPGEALTIEDGGTLHSTLHCAWSGPITLDGDAFFDVEDNGPSNLTLELSGVLSGPGGLTKKNKGHLVLTGTSPNAYTGVTHVAGGVLELSKPAGVLAVSGDLQVGDKLDASAKRVEWLAPSQVAITATLQADRNGTLDLNSFTQSTARLVVNDGGKIEGNPSAALRLDGPLLSTNINGFAWIKLALRLGPTATNVVVQGSSLILEGPLSSLGSALWETTGNGSIAFYEGGTYPGTIRVWQGSPFLPGSLPQATIDLTPGTRLTGTGQVARVTLHNAIVQPTAGIHPLRIGELSVDGLGSLECRVTAADTYGRIACATQPKLNGNVTLFFSTDNFDPAPGQSFTLVRNDSALPVAGTFANIPEGSLLKLQTNRYFRVTYQGGDGNDVVVTRIAPPIAPSLNSPARLPNGSIQIGSTGTPGAVYEVQATKLLGPQAIWQSIGQMVTPPNGILSFADTNATNYATRFYRFVLK